MTPLLAQAKNNGFLGDQSIWMLIGLGVLLLFGLFFVIIFFSFLRLWIQCFLTGAKIGIWDLVGMKLRNVDYVMIVRQKIALVQSGVRATTQELEAHYLSRRRAAHRGGGHRGAQSGHRSALEHRRRHRS